MAHGGTEGVPFDDMNWPAGSFVLLLLVATTVSLAARRFRVPYTVALVVAGLLLGATHAFPPPELTRKVMFGLVLPALVFEAAFDLQIEEVRHDGVTLAALAVPAVVAAIALTAFALSPALAAFGVPAWSIPARDGAVVFAALISATDPVAVVALFRQLEGPRRLQVLVEGESLFNDATAIIFFTLVLSNASGGISVSIVTDFFYIVGASLIVGIAVGAVCAEAIRRLYEPRLELLLTTVAAYGSFVAAEAVAASGVIATVAAGLLCGSRGRRGMSAMASIGVATFWEYVAFALNSFVFLSIGLMVHPSELLANWRPIVVAFAIVTFGRVVVTFAFAGLLPDRLKIPRRWIAILSWGGLRGALSMVLALSIPESFPQRQLLITMTFGVVILSIVIQGITVGPTLRWLGLRFQRGEEAGYVGTQVALLSAHSSLSDLDRTGGVLGANAKMQRALAEEYDENLDRAERALTYLGEQLGGNAASAHAARRLLASTERERVAEAFRSGSIDAAQRDSWLAELRKRWRDEEGGADS